MIWRRDLHNCAEQSHVFICRLEHGFGTCTVVHTQSMRKLLSLIHFQDGSGMVGVTNPACLSRGSSYKSAKEIQSPHPGLKLGSKSQQIQRMSPGSPPGMATDNCITIFNG